MSTMPARRLTSSTRSMSSDVKLSNDPLPLDIDERKLKQAVDAAFEPADEMTAAFVVTWKGRLIAESDPGGTVKREIFYLGDIPVGVFQ